MATNSLQSLHHCILKRHLSDNTTTATTPPSTLPSSLFLKPSTTSTTTSLSQSLSTTTTTTTTTTYSLSPTTATTTTSTSETVSFDLLHQHLSAQNFRQADEETRRLLIVLAGEAAQKRGYVFFSEVQFIPETELKAIDDLWRKYSNNKFGYSVQKRIWKKVEKDFTKFFMKVGWMKKLETEIEQYNYRSFPNEFVWELKEDTPEGHLPLTNALRGTQLLNCVLSHPAFEELEDLEEEKDDDKDQGFEEKGDNEIGINGSKPLNKRIFKSDYSF